MNKDTINIAAEMLARWPTITPEMMEEILWMTPYPAGTVSQIITQLDEAKRKWGDDPMNVMKMWYHEIEVETNKFLKMMREHPDQ